MLRNSETSPATSPLKCHTRDGRWRSGLQSSNSRGGLQGLQRSSGWLGEGSHDRSADCALSHHLPFILSLCRFQFFFSVNSCVLLNEPCAMRMLIYSLLPCFDVFLSQKWRGFTSSAIRVSCIYDFVFFFWWPIASGPVGKFLIK